MISARGRVDGKDAALWAALAAALGVLHAAVLLGGRVYFTGELTYISQPWLALTAQALQGGRVPLWNPYGFFGMPGLGCMQTGLFYPINTLFHFFSLGPSLAWHFALNSFLGGFWTHLWLRRRGFSRQTAFAGALVFALGGCVAGQLEFPHQVAALIHLPALFLFLGRPILLPLALAAGFLAGYPPKLLVMAVCLLALAVFSQSRRAALRRLLWAGALAGALSAPVLLPGLEYLRASSRGQQGLPLKERTYYSLAPVELSAFVHPELTRRLAWRAEKPWPFKEEITWTPDSGQKKTFTFLREHTDLVRDPAGNKYHSWDGFYVGFVGALLCLIGAGFLAARSPGKAAALGAAAGVYVLLVLGANTRPSAWLWEHFLALRYLRGPDRFLWLHLTVTPFLAALGLTGLRRLKGGRLVGLLAAAGLAAELFWTAWGYYPTMPANFFDQRGALVEYLGAQKGDNRYMQFQAVPVWAYVDKDDPSQDYRRYKEEVFNTFRQMNYALAGSMFRLGCVSPQKWLPLVPAGSARVIKFLSREEFGDLDRLAPYMRWAGIRYFLDWVKGRKKTRLAARGQHLWNVWEFPGDVSLAYWLPLDAEKELRRTFAEAPADVPGMRPWAHDTLREDRIRLKGSSDQEGLLYAADPYYPGWKLYVNGKRTGFERALDAFMIFRVPAGPVEAWLCYRPWPWRLGVLMCVLVLAVLAWRGAKCLSGLR